LTYHPPFLLAEREEVVSCALDAAEVFTAPVVDPTLTVWIRVVQDGNGVRHREPVRAELAGALRDGAPDERRRWAERLASEGWRVMATLEAGGRKERALTFSLRYEAADGEDGTWCRFAVELAGPDQALALARR
jgi:hypothetical protein